METLSRKEFLRTSGIALAAGLAGCGSVTSDTGRQTTTVPGDDPASSGAADDGEIGLFYVGSTTEGATDGRAEVIALDPSATPTKRPVVMVPGLGLAPYIYLTTPDGRIGWAERFVDAGHPVYLFDPPRNVGSGGLDTSAFGGENPPSLSRWSLDRAWPTWGFGPEAGTPYDDVRYPVGAVDQLVASFPAYVSGGGSGSDGGRQRGGATSGDEGDDRQRGSDGDGGSRFASARETDALESLLERVGPATLVVHSAGGASGFAVARTVPTLVDRLVAVEPVGAPTDEDVVAEMGGDAPFMAVYGDYVDERGQTGRKAACEMTVELASEAAPSSRMLDLPKRGVAGNTHLLMQDDNNVAIADRIVDWLDGMER